MSHHFPTAPLPTGKLSLTFLKELLERYSFAKHGVRVGAGLGCDAAVIEHKDRLLIAKTDPITFVADNIGHYALYVNANDVACMGGEPKWFLSTILLPEGKTRQDDVERIFKQLNEACQSIGVSLCGGHTEITAAVTQPVVVGCLLADAPPERNFSPQNIQPNDCVILTKGLAVEATSILGREKEKELDKLFDPAFTQQCQRFLFEPGISVLPEAKLMWDIPGVHAMHDPTEGGLANALHELLEDRNLGIEIDLAEVPIFPETKLLCEQYKLDPLGIIASGALLVIAEEKASTDVLHRFKRARIDAAVIGTILPEGGERWLLDSGERVKLPLFRFDEIIKVF